MRSVVQLCVVVCLASSTTSAFAQPTIPFKSRELQEGKNYVQSLTTRLTVGEASGQVSTTYPIVLPPGRGITPTLEYQYSSSAGQSEFGFGWELTIPMIERSTRSGVPQYNFFTDKFQFRNGHEVIELEQAGSFDGWTQYRERSERTFSRYLFLNNTWRILKPNGIVIELGTVAGARRGLDPSVDLKTAAWLVTKISDPHTNYATYSYSPDPVGNARIAGISYSGNDATGLAPVFHVEFQWATAWGTSFPTPFSFRSGYKRVFGQQQLSFVVVTAPPHATGTSPAQVPASSPTTKTYRFSYAASNTVDRMFYLIAARVVGFPPTTFAYSASLPSGTFNDQHYEDSRDRGGLIQNLPDNLGLSETTRVTETITETKTRRLLADINSDGRPDLIDATPCSSYIVWINTGSGFIRDTWNPLTSTGPLPDQCSLRTSTGDSAETFGSSTVTQDFFDLDGDGFPDIVYFASGTLRYCPGTGSGFAPCTTYSSVLPAGAELRKEFHEGTSFTRTSTDLIDINGDGLVDSVAVSGTAMFVRLNLGRGNGFSSTQFVSTAPPCGISFMDSCLRVTEVVSSSTANRMMWVEIKDINGDGIPDFLATDPTTLMRTVRFGQFTYAGGCTPGQPCDEGPKFGQPVPIDLGPGIAGFGMGTQSGGNYVANADLIDVNTDGLPDVVVKSTSAASITVRLNLGGGFFDSNVLTYSLATDSPPPFRVFNPAELSRVSELQPSGGVESRTATLAQFIDMNGDGIPDFISTEISPVLNTTVVVRQLPYSPPRKLIQAQSLNRSSTFTVGYAPVNGTAPYPLHVAQRITRFRTSVFGGEPVRNRTTQTTYDYSNMGFDRSFREFTAFGTVIATGDSFATSSTTNFDTDLYKAGLVLTRSVANNAAAGVSDVTINTYTIRTNAICFNCRTPELTRTERLPGLARDLVTDYVAYDAFGNPTNWVERGDPSTAVDDINHTRTYVSTESSARLLVVLSTESGGSTAGGPLPTIRHYYDGLPLGAAPVRGEPTKLEREKTPGVFIATQALFDANGNLILEADPLGTATTHLYDSTYQQFRVSTTDPIGTVRRSFHALTGTVADTCGPQFSGTTFRCSRTEIDFLGRTIATYVPTLVGGVYSKALFATVAYDDNVYPLMTTLTKRGVSRTIEYRDGFGNPTEERVEETANTFRVFETSFDAYGKPLRVELARREAGTGYTHAPISAEAWTYAHDYVHDSIERITHPRDPGDTTPAATATRVVFADRVESTDEDGRVVNYFLDGYNRVIQVQRLPVFAGPIATTSFLRTTAGDITRIIDPDEQVSLYGRNLLGWETSFTAPDNGTTTFELNARGEITSSTDPRGVVVTNTYDTVGRLIHVLSSNEPVGVRHVDATNTYFDITNPTQIGWLQSASSDGITQSYTYTAEGATATHRSQFGAHMGTVSFSYNIGHLLDRVTYPDGLAAAYSYNLDDSVRQVRDPNSNLSFGDYLYEDDGQPSVVTNAFGLDETYGYDARGRSTAITSTNTNVTAGDLVDDRISYTKASLVTRLDRRGLKPNLVTRSTPDVFAMTPDPLGRLARVDLNGSQFAIYAYTRAGHITNFNELGATTSSTSTYANDKLVLRTFGEQSRSFAYDAAGDVTHDELKVFGALLRARDHAWDAVGRYTSTQIVNATSTTYYYTPQGELSRVTQPGELVTNADMLRIGQFARKDMTSGVWTDSIVANGNVVGESTGPRFEMPHRTLQATVGAVTDDLGQVIRQEDFNPYGSRLEGTPNGRFESHFHGLRADELLVAGRRAYDSESGIWLSRDPLLLSAPDHVADDTRIAYGYVFNFGDPLSFRDPTGTDWSDVGGFLKSTMWDNNPWSPAPYISLARGDWEGAVSIELGRAAIAATVVVPGVGGIAVGSVLQGASTKVDGGSWSDAGRSSALFGATAIVGTGAGKAVSAVCAAGDAAAAGAAEGLDSFAREAADAVASAPAGSTVEQLTGAAQRAIATMGPGRGPVYGTRAHSAFRAEVDGLGRSDLISEVSYLNGEVVPYGTRGSVRLDVVEGTIQTPTACYDLKTGSARLTAARIQQIRNHLPEGMQDIPILEVRGE